MYVYASREKQFLVLDGQKKYPGFQGISFGQSKTKRRLFKI